MAQVKWLRHAEQELFKYLVIGFEEFGAFTVNKFMEKVRRMNEELASFPEMGYQEPLLKERKKIYRTYHLNRRFKVIYYFAQKSDIVYVADIWDKRREPLSLAKRIKK